MFWAAITWALSYCPVNLCLFMFTRLQLICVLTTVSSYICSFVVFNDGLLRSKASMLSNGSFPPPPPSRAHLICIHYSFSQFMYKHIIEEWLCFLRNCFRIISMFSRRNCVWCLRFPFSSCVGCISIWKVFFYILFLLITLLAQWRIVDWHPCWRRKKMSWFLWHVHLLEVRLIVLFL